MSTWTRCCRAGPTSSCDCAAAARAPGLLLNGHIDAGYVPDGWSHDPLDAWEAEGRLYGGAVSDMLGGVAAMMETMLAAAESEPLPGDLVLLANMYHDSNGLGTKYALAVGGRLARIRHQRRTDLAVAS